jgi:hypothetical protein
VDRIGSSRGSIRRYLFAALLMGAMAALSGCATMYVDNGLKDVPTTAYRHPASPQPVQMFFSFQSKGVPNTRATEILMKTSSDVVADSGLFIATSPNPVPSGALLSITVNNVPVTDDAFTKGFVTGLTMGLAGSTVTDGYVCTVVYQGMPGGVQLTKSVRHMIHTTIGAKGAPADSTKASSVRAAITTVVHQCVGNALLSLSTDLAFAP